MGLDIGKLTIEEVESIVDRATRALLAFKEAQAMLGAPIIGTQTNSSRAQTVPVHVDITPSRNEFTASELIERRRLLASLRGPEFPEAIAAAEVES